MRVGMGMGKVISTTSSSSCVVVGVVPNKLMNGGRRRRVVVIPSSSSSSSSSVGVILGIGIRLPPLGHRQYYCVTRTPHHHHHPLSMNNNNNNNKWSSSITMMTSFRAHSSSSNNHHDVNESGSIDSPLISSMHHKIKEQLNAESVIVKDAYGDGRHVSIDVISSVFEGESAVSRQRMVYKAIWEELQNTVHAVDQMTTKTPAEAAATNK